MPAATSAVIYPQGTKFNMDYYLSSHMPLVYKKWASEGLKSWKVTKFSDEDQFSVLATLEWESDESYKKALAGPDTKEILGDVSNFSDKSPVFVSGPVVGSS